ncbi:single-stranded DNA-binding protein [Limosilactobacillus fermentum]|uniref:single-stranded DNA-binding protein n=1 Tax=Limosilactobacillus fermentum TaxID=1613 RepID=UPI001363A737|nr:single-stranded DNA-binding protein [Limosilactobacillus fermentum]MCZ2326539.1 single-stranded DNA-binding protein [Limosilactobacillus fermentum]
MSEATIQFQGRLTNEPQQRQVGNYTVTNIDVAVDGSRKDQQGNKKAEYYRVAVWGNRGDFVRNYLHKGQPVMVSGTLTTHQYKRNDGGTGISLDVRADHVDFVLSQPRNQQGDNLPQGPAPQYNQQPNQAPQQFNQQQNQAPQYNQQQNQAPQYNQQAGNGFNQQAGQAPAPQNAPQGSNMGNYPNRPQNGSQGLEMPGQSQPVDPTDLPF